MRTYERGSGGPPVVAVERPAPAAKQKPVVVRQAPTPAPKPAQQPKRIARAAGAHGGSSAPAPLHVTAAPRLADYATSAEVAHLLDYTTTKTPRGRVPNNSAAAAFLRTTAAQLASQAGEKGVRNYLALSSAGIPMLTFAPAQAVRVRKFIEGLANRDGDLSGVPSVEVLQQRERDQIHAFLGKRGTDPGPGASDAELLKAVHKQPLGYLDALKNIPASAAKAATGIPMAAWEAGHAAADIATGKGTARARRIGTGIVDYYAGVARDPVRALEQDPVGTVVNVALPGKAAVGRAIGSAARTGALGAGAKGFMSAERAHLPLPKTEPAMGIPGVAPRPQVLDAGLRPVLSKNIVDRAAQVTLDKLIQSSERLSHKAVGRQAAKVAGQMHHTFYGQQRPRILRDLRHEARVMSKNEQEAAIWFAQGETPIRMLAYYMGRLGERPQNVHIRGQVRKLQKVVRSGITDTPTPRIQKWLDAARPQAANREAALTEIGGVGEEVFGPRRTLVHDEVQKTLEAAEHPLAEALPTVEPFYVPHTAGGGKARDFLMPKGTTLQRRINAELKTNEGHLLKSGRIATSMRDFEAALVRVPAVKFQLDHIKNQFARSAKPVMQGERWDADKFDYIPETTTGGFRIKAPDTAGPALAAQLRSLRGDTQKAPDAALVDELLTTVMPRGGARGVQTADQAGFLIPKEVSNVLRGSVRSFASRSAFFRGAETLTMLWRYVTLMLRPAYLANNVAGNTLQSVVAGAGPVSVARAIRAHGPIDAGPVHIGAGKWHGAVPEWIYNSGTISDMTRIQRLGDLANTPVLGGIDKAMQRLPANPIRSANVGHENILRAAVYLRHAVPEAKTALGDRLMTKTDAAMQHLTQNESQAAGQVVADFLGDYRKMQTTASRTMRLAMPFYRWIGFITKLTLITLPVKYPVRNAILQQLGSLGNEDLSRMGILPQWLQGAIPVDTSTQTNPRGGQDVYADLFSMGGLNPFASPSQFFTTSTGGEDASSEGLARSINPMLQAAYAAWKGRDFSTDFPTTGTDAFLGSFPLYNLFNTPTPSGKGDHQPVRDFTSKLIGYLTGINIRPYNLSLANRQATYGLLNLPGEGAPFKDTRHRLNVDMGKAMTDAEKKAAAKARAKAKPHTRPKRRKRPKRPANSSGQTIYPG